MYFYYLYDLMTFIISVLFWAYMYGWVKKTYNALFKSKHMRYSVMARHVIFVFLLSYIHPRQTLFVFQFI